MSKIFNSSKFKKFITPSDIDALFKSINNINFFNDELKYRIETGYFSKDNPEKSIGIIYVDIEKKQIAGIAFVYIEKEILADLETIKEYRNNGIGTKLVEEAISLGAKYLAVNNSNKIAINLYKKCNFKEYYNDKDEKLCYMSITGKPHPEDIEIKNKGNKKVMRSLRICPINYSVRTFYD